MIFCIKKGNNIAIVTIIAMFLVSRPVHNKGDKDLNIIFNVKE